MSHLSISNAPGTASDRTGPSAVSGAELAHDVATLQLAKRTIDTSPHLTGEDLTSILLGSPTRHEISRLRKHGSVLGLRFTPRGYLYPEFQFDRINGRVDPTVAKVNRALLRKASVDRCVLWWFAPTPNGPRPLDLLAQDRDELHREARAFAAPAESAFIDAPASRAGR